MHQKLKTTDMIQEIKKEDLAGLSMNPQDVMLLVDVELGKKSTIDLSELSPETQEDLNKDKELLIGIELVCKGSEVIQFEVGQKVSLRSNKCLKAYEPYNEDGSKRIAVVGVGNIAYAK